ncbi:MAG: FHA domain-containing protein [Streptosporangiaceae bacterium]
MTKSRDAGRRPPVPPRSRRRWAVAGGVLACWAVLLIVTGSAIGAAVLLAVIAAIGVIGVMGLRALGITRDHPWVQQLSSRPWRDGQEVLQVALRHLPEVFVVTPSGALLAPSSIELQLNPDDLRSLLERMDLDLVTSSAAEVYEEQVAAHSAQFSRPGPPQVQVTASSALPPGRYRLRQGQPLNAGQQELAYAAAPVYSAAPAYAAAPVDSAAPAYDAAPAYSAAPAYDAAPVYDAPRAAYAGARDDYTGPVYPNFSPRDGNTRSEAEPALARGEPTAVEQSKPRVPTLRLVTGDSMAQTTTSGAVAGRGEVELALPQVPTVSREHARFTFASGQWWITNLGRNGLTINGVPLAGERPLSTGDLIRWGSRPDALQSWVEVS